MTTAGRAPQAALKLAGLCTSKFALVAGALPTAPLVLASVPVALAISCSDPLLPPAERFLAEASRFKKTARWLDLGATPDDDSEAAPADSDDRDDGQTRTGDSDDPDSSGEAEVVQPRHLRVTGPSTVALEHFISVTNSGCFSEG